MDKPIETAIASFGMSGKVFHAPLLRANPRFRVRAVLERTKNLSATWFPDAGIVRSYDQLLKDPDIELVIVNTPDRLHYEMTEQALRAGKNVVVEKPFTLRTREAEDLIGLAKSQQLVLTVYQNRRWDGDFLTVQKIVRSGLLGEPSEFESHFDRYRPFIVPGTWKEEEDEYTGVLYNLGSHMVDQALLLFGMPEMVTAHLNIVRPGGKVNDYYDIRLHYPKFSALLKSSLLVREEGPRYIIHGTHGSYLKWGIDPQEELLKSGGIPHYPDWGKEPESRWGTLNVSLKELDFHGKIATLNGNYPAFYDNLYESIRFGKPVEVQPEESRDVIRILETCMESHRLKKSISMLP